MWRAFITALAFIATPAAAQEIDFDLRDTLVQAGPPAYVEQIEHIHEDFHRGVEERRIAFHALNIADLATTAYCLEIADNCREANPIYGQSLLAVVAGKAVSAGLYEFGLSRLRESGASHREIRRYQWIAIVINGAVVGWNIKVLL